MWILVDFKIAMDDFKIFENRNLKHYRLDYFYTCFCWTV